MKSPFSTIQWSYKDRLKKLTGLDTLECINCRQKVEKSQVALGKVRKLGKGKCECIEYIGHYCKRIRETYPNAFIRSPVSQNEANIKRYFFSNKEFNIIVWEATDKNIIGFEIIFQDFIKEISVRWKVNEKPRVSIVNTGTRTPFKNLTPTLNGAYDINWEDFSKSFEVGMVGTEAPILIFVRNVVLELGKSE